MNPNLGFLQSPQFAGLTAGMNMAGQMQNQNPYQPQQLNPMQMMPLMSLLHGMPQGNMQPGTPPMPNLPMPGSNMPMGGMGAPFNQSPLPSNYLNMIGQQPQFMGG